MRINYGLTDKIAVVTGAAHGIGRACGLALGAAGANLALLDIDASGLEDTATAVRALGRTVLAQETDCTDSAQVEAALQRVYDTFGQIDILVNNVGQSARERASQFCDSAEETWKFVIDISLFTTLRCSRLVVPGMRRRGRGKIINIASDTALVGDAGLVDYASAKMGVIGFTRALARELAPHGITVNAVCPGTIHTRAHASLPAEVLERIRAGVPMGYIADPEDVAPLVTFLSGAGSRYITGQSILVDGGRWMV